MRNIIASVLLILIFGPATEVFAQSHFTECASLTGNNATILIPSGASITLDGSPLSKNSEIAVFTDEGLCAGVLVWKRAATALSVWGDDSQSSAKDGFASGESLSYRVWDASKGAEYDGADLTPAVAFSDAQPFYSTSNAYSENAIYELTSFSMETTPTDAKNPDVPGSFTLHPTYPNPFNPTATIRYDLPTAADVRVTIYNAAGAQIDVLVEGSMPAGRHEMRWEAGNLPSGTYFCRIQSGNQTQLRTMVLLK